MRKAQPDTSHITSKGIGGSDITAIMGLDEYNTPFTVWERKTGKVPRSEGNQFTKAGQFLEDGIAQWFSAESGHQIYHIHPPDVPYKEAEPLRHPDHPHLIGFVDRGVSLKGGDGILEIKNTARFTDKEDVMKGDRISWFFQVQWYLGISGRKKGFIAWLVQGYQFDWLQIDFDQEIFDEMVQMGNDFWNNHIVANVPPPPIRRTDIEKMYKRVKAVPLEVDEEVLQVHNQISLNTAKIAELTDANNELKEMVQLMMLDKDRVTFNNITLFTWRQYEQTRVDLTYLKKNHPRIHKKCLKTIKVRKFNIK